MGISYAKKSANQQIQSDSIISSNLPSRRCLSLNDERMEPFTLIWLDESAQENSLDSLRTQTLFREINNDICLFFDEPDQFLSDIERMITERKKLLVVMSGSFAKEVLPKIKFDSISTIIIFCGNYNKYASLKMKYSNVVDICTEHEKLKSCIQNELISLKFNLFTNQILKSLRPLASSNAVENSGAHFSYMSFIELLKQMPQTEQAKDIMLNKCQDYYRGNKSEMKLIETFRNTYTSDKAIDWYTRDSFVYRLVNRAFRTEDVTLWYLFRYYVSDLCTQLESVHKEQNIKTRLTLYRGQPQMPVHELENLKSNLGCLVSINGFCSSSIDIGIAKQFIIDVKDTENFKVVIFEITVDGSSLHNTIFVDIDRYTGTAGESEVLFNIGSVFKIESVNHDSDLGAWIIKMNATDEGTHEIKRKIEAKKKEVHKGNLNLMFGRLLIDINEYAKAESYFQMMLQVLPTYHEDVPLVYDHIGDLSMKTTNWNEAFINYNLAYKIKKKALPSNHPVIGVTLNNIGNYFKAIGDYVQALEYYTKALQCTNDPSSIARTQLNIGAIYGKNRECDKALSLCIEARDTLQQVSPCSYDEIIHYQGIIGDIYLTQQDYDSAGGYYFTAFELSKKVLSTGNRLRISCTKAIADLYDQQGMKEKALEFCLEQLSFFEKYLPESHVNIAHISMKIGELYEDNDDEKKIHSLQRATRILLKNVHLEYATTANCLMMIAEYHQKRNAYDRALKYYIKALEIRMKIYPKDHSTILETQSLIDTGENQS